MIIPKSAVSELTPIDCIATAESRIIKDLVCQVNADPIIIKLQSMINTVNEDITIKLGTSQRSEKSFVPTFKC